MFVVRNESDHIQKTLSNAVAAVSPLVSDYELIIVDNASNDESVRILSQLTAENGLPNLQVYALTKKVDSDTASWVGLENALGDFVGVVDPLADDLRFLPEMLDKAVSDQRRGCRFRHQRTEDRTKSFLLCSQYRFQCHV